MSSIEAAPWDARALGRPAWQANNDLPQTLAEAATLPGLVSVRVNPLSDKRELTQHGFYYCDTLLQPYCTLARLRPSIHAAAELRDKIDAKMALELAYSGFCHGRFFRDGAIAPEAAKLRYRFWLQDLLQAGCVQGLFWQGQQAGFMAVKENVLILHAIAESFRGKGLAKFWWTAACQRVCAQGHAEVLSSVSASNHAVVNLYASLGFRFRDAQDVYHRIANEEGGH